MLEQNLEDGAINQNKSQIVFQTERTCKLEQACFQEWQEASEVIK